MLSENIHFVVEENKTERGGREEEGGGGGYMKRGEGRGREEEIWRGNAESGERNGSVGALSGW